jgi:3-hydroxypropanoate dehydrogenase
MLPALSPGNVDKTTQAPVTVIIAYDTRFYELLPKLFPHRPEMANPYKASAALAETTAFRNGTLQGARLRGGVHAPLTVGPYGPFGVSPASVIRCSSRR